MFNAGEAKRQRMHDEIDELQRKVVAQEKEIDALKEKLTATTDELDGLRAELTGAMADASAAAQGVS